MSSVLPHLLRSIGTWSGHHDFDETLAVLWLCSVIRNDEGVKRAHALLQSHPGMTGTFNSYVVNQPGSMFTFLTRFQAVCDNQLALSEIPSRIPSHSPMAIPTGAQVRSEWDLSLDWPARTWSAQSHQSSLQGYKDLMYSIGCNLELHAHAIGAKAAKVLLHHKGVLLNAKIL